MNCLCCGKPLHMQEEQSGWHRGCIKRFFGTSVMPEIIIDEKTLELLARESTNNGFTVPGVQKKLSLHLLSEGKKPRLTLLNYPSGYILKPQVRDFRALPEAEQLVMSMADIAGIATVPHALIMGQENYAYITRRVDRKFEEKRVTMLAMEDFCQLDLRLTQDKYRGSYERVQLDMTELYMRLVFSFLVGNSDMHLKNFSLIETAEGSAEYVLSPAYDLLPVNVVMPEDKEQFALALNGKKMNIGKKDFFIFAKENDISVGAAEKMINRMVAMSPRFIAMSKDSLLPEDLKETMIQLIEKRSEILKSI